jgi:L-alanine-DL-glutamate epimerase-like enolase superfamily enzyme
VKLSVHRRVLTLARPLPTSYGTVSERELLAISLTDGAGASGHGEAAPLPAYDGVSLERAQCALERHRLALAACGDRSDEHLIEACRRADPLPVALAAVEMALWDRAGRLQGKPVAALLSERHSAAVPVNATLSALEPAAAAEQAAAAAAAGFSCVKVKVGVGDDGGRLAAVRAAAGAAVALRVDANGAWDVEQAVHAIDALSPLGLELVEEPVHGVAAIREVRARVAVRIAIDETAAQEGALDAGAAHAVCLKISRCGGISELIAAAGAVRASGAEPYLASTLDGPVGTAAALHAAAALAARGPLPHCGLATLGLFAEIEDQLPPRNGEIALPAAPGLGVEPL